MFGSSRSALKPTVLVAVVVPALIALVACSPAPMSEQSARPVNSTTPAASSSVPGVSAPSDPLTTAGSTPATAVPASTSATAKPTKPVHISLLENDGGTYGVGMPIIAWFNVKPTDAHALAAATTVTANGQPVAGGWYFEATAHAGAALEGHWRPEVYWPAHTSVHVSIPAKGLSAGNGLTFDDSLTLDISIGASHIATVDAHTLRMTVVSDNKLYGTFPVSLGASDTPTSNGTKVIMEKGLDISMRGPGYYDPHVEYTQRLTYGGEYLHSAPWNVNNIGYRSTSNGCTNLLPDQAKQLYNFLIIGDVVKFPNANGPAMQLGSGYGDWNVSWTQWQTGGALAV